MNVDYTPFDPISRGLGNGCRQVFIWLMGIVIILGVAAYLVREQTALVGFAAAIVVIVLIIKAQNKGRPRFKEWQGQDSVWEYKGRFYRGRDDRWLDLEDGQLVTATNTAEKNWLNVVLMRGHTEMLRQRPPPDVTVNEENDYRSG